MTQAELFEPTPAELPTLVTGHVRRAEAEIRLATVFEARGWQTLAQAAKRRAMASETQAETLAQLADFYALGGVH